MTMLKRFLVKKESLPVRCEVCHQIDQFDPIDNKCERCEKIKEESMISAISSEENDQYRVTSICKLFGTQLGYIIGHLTFNLVCIVLLAIKHNLIYKYSFIFSFGILGTIIGKEVAKTILKNKNNVFINYLRKMSITVPLAGLIGWLPGHMLAIYLNNIVYELLGILAGMLIEIICQQLFPKQSKSVDDKLNPTKNN